jgi:hypothetical protein
VEEWAKCQLAGEKKRGDIEEILNLRPLLCNISQRLALIGIMSRLNRVEFPKNSIFIFDNGFKHF